DVRQLVRIATIVHRGEREVADQMSRGRFPEPAHIRVTRKLVLPPVNHGVLDALRPPRGAEPANRELLVRHQNLFFTVRYHSRGAAGWQRLVGGLSSGKIVFW